jgi:hypothetical protein
VAIASNEENVAATDVAAVVATVLRAPQDQQHIATMARLHRDDRYNRLTHDVEDLTGRPAQSVQEYISQRRELFT